MVTVVPWSAGPGRQASLRAARSHGVGPPGSTSSRSCSTAVASMSPAQREVQILVGRAIGRGRAVLQPGHPPVIDHALPLVRPALARDLAGQPRPGLALRRGRLTWATAHPTKASACHQSRETLGPVTPRGPVTARRYGICQMPGTEPYGESGWCPGRSGGPHRGGHDAPLHHEGAGCGAVPGLAGQCRGGAACQTGA